MITSEQLSERTSYIGASECAAVMGLSRWDTPLSVWSRKTGQIVEEQKDSLAMEIGNELEDVVCRLFTKRSGKQLARVNETAIHPKYDFIRANLDRRVVGEDAVFEAKTASGWKAREWLGEDIPIEYILQVQHQLAVTGKKHGYIGCLIGGNQEFVWKPVVRDEGMIRKIIETEVNFWNNFVLTGSMPMVTKRDGDTLYALYPHGEDKEITLDEHANQIADLLVGLKEDCSILEGTIELQENLLKAMLKDATVGLTDRYKISWKSQITKRLDSSRMKKESPELYETFCKETPSRVFRVAELKVGGK